MSNKSKKLTKQERKKQAVGSLTKIKLSDENAPNVAKETSKQLTPFQEEPGSNVPTVPIGRKPTRQIDRPQEYDPKHIKLVKAFAKKVLRRASYRQWPARNEAKAAARVARGMYKCAHCSKLFGPKEIEMDHVDPVVRIGSEDQSLDEFALRLFIPSTGYAALCSPCHNTKTQNENILRKIKKRISK